MKRTSVFAFLALVLALGFAAEARSEIQTPPGLKPGDQFRIVFVTSTTRGATSSDIADYDAFVTERAKAGGLDTYAGNPVIWQAICSTVKVAAKSRLPGGASPALYLPSGQQVAVNGEEFWSNDIAYVLPIDLDESGRGVPRGRVWSGTSGKGEDVDPVNGLTYRLGEVRGGESRCNLWVDTPSRDLKSRLLRIAPYTTGQGAALRVLGFSSVLTAPKVAVKFAAKARTEIETPAGLKPGDKFRMVFITSTTFKTTSSDIADYDAFVTARAKAGGLTTYAGKPVTWGAIGTTVKVSAQSRLPGTSPALFLPSGQKIAASGDDFWSNDIAFVRPIDLDENGRGVVPDTMAWTGETFDSNVSPPVKEDGFRLGEKTDGVQLYFAIWIDGLPRNPGSRASRVCKKADATVHECRLYGFSSELTVPGGK